ncbi:MAG: hypothetical protein AB1651_14605 [Pseudomonadota bacterium]
MNVDLAEPVRSDLHLLYQVTVSDLAFFKSQQWAITNYSVLVYAGLVGLAQVVAQTALSKLVLVGVVVTACLAAIQIVRALDRSIVGRQARLTYIRSNLSQEFNEAWGSMDKRPEFLLPKFVLYATVAIGAGLATWAIVCR